MRPTDSAFDGWHFPGVLFEVSPHKIMKTNAELMADPPVEGQTQASPSSQEPRLALVEKPNVQFQIADIDGTHHLPPRFAGSVLFADMEAAGD